MFYIILAIILVGTSIGRKKNGAIPMSGDKKHTVQVVEGNGVKCEVVGDKDITVYLEEEV